MIKRVVVFKKEGEGYIKNKMWWEGEEKGQRIKIRIWISPWVHACA